MFPRLSPPTRRDGDGVCRAGGHLRSADGDETFAAYFEPRTAALLRFAYLLTGDLGEAEDLTQTTLTKVYLAWQRVSGHETAAGGRGERLLHP